MPVPGYRRWSLAVHAGMVGIGWFVAGMALAITASVDQELVEDLLDVLPPALTGGAIVVAAAVSVPLLWPVWLAIGWFEAGLVSRLARGEDDAVRLARRALHLQAAAWLALGVACVVVTSLPIDAYADPISTEVRLAFLGPLLAAAWHLATAWSITRLDGRVQTA